MKYGWLEKMAGGGNIRPEVLDMIYHDCSELLQKEASRIPSGAKASAIGANAGAILSAMLMGATPTGLEMVNKNIRRKVVDQQTKMRTEMVKSRVLAMFPSKDHEKVEARFDEIVRYAPALGTIEPFMRKLIKKKLHTGLTDRDVQALLNSQKRMSPDPLRYTKLDPEAEKQLSQLAMKTAAATNDPEKIETAQLEYLGEKLAEAFHFIDSNLYQEKTAQGFTGGKDPLVATRFLGNSVKPTGVGGALKTVALLSAMSGLTALGRAGLDYYKGKSRESEMRSRLDESFKEVVRTGRGTEIAEDKDKAMDAFKTLAHFAPQVASEPRAAKVFVRKMLSFDQAPTTEDLKQLTDIQKNMTAGRSSMLDSIQESISQSGFDRAMSDTWKTVMSPYAEKAQAGVYTEAGL